MHAIPAPLNVTRLPLSQFLLRLYLYKDGLVRFATENYSEEEGDLKNPFVHLTNYAVNRGNKENQEEKGKFVHVDFGWVF